MFATLVNTLTFITNRLKFDLCNIDYLSFISDAEAIDSHGRDVSVKSLMKFEANEYMNYVERMHEERSKTDFNQKHKQTEGDIFLFSLKFSLTIKIDVRWRKELTKPILML